MLICQAAFVASSWGTVNTGSGEAALKGISTYASSAWGPSLVTLLRACIAPLGRPHFMWTADKYRIRQRAHALKGMRQPQVSIFSQQPTARAVSSH